MANRKKSRKPKTQRASALRQPQAPLLEPEGPQLPTMTHASGVVTTHREGTVIVRDSWPIHPDEVVSASRDRDGNIVVKTIHANYILSDEEAASVGAHVAN